MMDGMEVHRLLPVRSSTLCRNSFEELTGGPKRRCMKVLLQDLGTLSFLASEGDWTTNSTEAFDFGQVVNALDYALRNRLQNVRAVIKCSDSKYDVELPAVYSNG